MNKMDLSMYIKEDILFQSINSLLTQDNNIPYSFLEKINHLAKADLTVFYKTNISSKNNFKFTFKIGSYETPKIIKCKIEVISFLKESNEIIFLNKNNSAIFSELFLNEEMNSLVAFPINYSGKLYGVIIINFLNENALNKKNIILIEKFKNFIDRFFLKNNNVLSKN